MTKRHYVFLLITSLVLWYAAMLLWPRLEPGTPSIYALIAANLRHIANKCNSLESAKAEIPKLTWKDSRFGYKVTIEADSQRIWRIVAKPSNTEVYDCSLINRIIFLNFAKHHPQTYSIKQGLSQVEEQ